MKRLPLFLQLIAAVLAGCLLAITIVLLALHPPMQDLRQLFLFMFATGIATVTLAYLIYKRQLLRRYLSLRWALFTLVVITVLLIFINVWITARMMYISEHDLVLTTALLVFAGVIAVVSTLFIASTLRERIQELSKGVGALAEGNLTTRLAVSGNDELSHLAEMFNQMVASLQELDQQKQQLEQTRRDLIAWVSHDLRTPLTAMRAMNEAMLDGVVSDTATIQRYRENIQNEIQHLSQMIDDLFELAQLDTGRVALNRQMTSLHDLVSDTLSRMTARAAEGHIHLSASVDPAIKTVYLAPDKIQRVLYNLLDNALRYTPPEGQVALKAQRDDGHVEISVYNSGSYINADDLAHVFESFYRGEQSRAKTDAGRRGTGLGLAIVRGFVEAHGGTIRVESQSGYGTTFFFTLPNQSPVTSA